MRWPLQLSEHDLRWPLQLSEHDLRRPFSLLCYITYSNKRKQSPLVIFQVVFNTCLGDHHVGRYGWLWGYGGYRLYVCRDREETSAGDYVHHPVLEKPTTTATTTSECAVVGPRAG